MAKERDYGFDNLKFLLILCVVLGHGLARLDVDNGIAVYRIIFSFHMPLFLFISGWFGKFSSKKVVELVWLYVLLQTVWFFFDTYVMGEKTVLQYSTPSWSLWYLPALAFYTLVTPLYDVGEKKRPLVLAVTVALALLAGFDDNIGRAWTASRFFVFQPFYVAGYYGRRLERPIPRPKGIWWLVLAALFALSLRCIDAPGIIGKTFHGAYSYSELDYNPLIRGWLMLAAAVWIYLFMAVVKPLMPGKIPVISRLGTNTLPIYLLHGFVLDLLEMLELPQTWPALLGLTVLCLAVCGNPLAAKLFDILTFKRKPRPTAP